VSSQQERRSFKNKATAMRCSRTSSYHIELEKQAGAEGGARRDEERRELRKPIRSYVFQPYTMVNDHARSSRSPTCRRSWSAHRLRSSRPT
jgi:peptide chain release factor 2